MRGYKEQDLELILKKFILLGVTQVKCNLVVDTVDPVAWWWCRNNTGGG